MLKSIKFYEVMIHSEPVWGAKRSGTLNMIWAMIFIYFAECCPIELVIGSLICRQNLQLVDILWVKVWEHFEVLLHTHILLVLNACALANNL